MFPGFHDLEVVGDWPRPSGSAQAGSRLEGCSCGECRGVCDYDVQLAGVQSGGGWERERSS